MTQTIRIETKPLVPKPCEICGDNKAELHLGLFKWLCPNCGSIVDKVISRFINSLLYRDFREVVEMLHRHLQVEMQKEVAKNE